MTLPGVRLDPTVERWLADRGGRVTLRASPRHGCCGGTAHLPVAEVGAPDDPVAWPVRQLDGITIHIDPALAGAAEVLAVRAEGLGRWRRLFVEVAATGSD